MTGFEGLSRYQYHFEGTGIVINFKWSQAMYFVVNRPLIVSVPLPVLKSNISQSSQTFEKLFRTIFCSSQFILWPLTFTVCVWFLFPDLGKRPSGRPLGSAGASRYLWRTGWSPCACCGSAAWGSSRTPPPRRSSAAAPWGRRSGSTRASCPARWWSRAHFAPTPGKKNKK